MTAALCIAGAIALHELEDMGISISSRIVSINGCNDEKSMFAAIEQAKQAGDSVGGVVECAVTGLPVGLGEPIFDGLENRIAAAVFGIPAVKGIEFGAGFAAASMRGSEHNDPFVMGAGGAVRTATNNHGGILGGLSSGMPLVFRAAFKPTPSIGLPQKTVNLSEKVHADLVIEGRHDPCVAVRAVPCVEAAAAIAVWDLMAKEN